MYRVLSVGDDFHEVCDECGFDGGTLDVAATAGRLRGLAGHWAEVMAHDEALVRARPEPDVWCVVEYAQHVTCAINEIGWATRRVADGHAIEWDLIEDGPFAGVFDHPVHECERFDITATLADLDAAARSMADLVEGLSSTERAARAIYYKDEELTTTAMVRHALHDAEHHVLDVRRGIARQRLRG